MNKNELKPIDVSHYTITDTGQVLKPKEVVVEHFEAYGQCRDSRRIAGLEAENEKLKTQNAELKEAIKQFIIDYPVITKELLDKLEQFVKECEG